MRAEEMSQCLSMTEDKVFHSLGYSRFLEEQLFEARKIQKQMMAEGLLGPIPGPGFGGVRANQMMAEGLLGDVVGAAADVRDGYSNMAITINRACSNDSSSSDENSPNTTTTTSASASRSRSRSRSRNKGNGKGKKGTSRRNNNNNDNNNKSKSKSQSKKSNNNNDYNNGTYTAYDEFDGLFDAKGADQAHLPLMGTYVNMLSGVMLCV